MERNSKGQFIKGGIPHNKGKNIGEYISDAGLSKIKKTQFKNGNMPHNITPKGTVSGIPHRRNGVIVGIDWFINIDWRGNRHVHYNYRKYLWEIYNQQDAPEGMCFVALNGDYTAKPTIENVEMISRSELIRRNNPKTR